VFGVALSVAATLVVVGIPVPSHAQDPGDVEAQIDEAWRELEPVIEEHNATRIELKEAKQGVGKLQKKIKPLQKEVDRTMAQVSEIAVQAFKSGGNAATLHALLSSGSPYQLADQLAALDQMAKAQQAEIAEVTEAKEKFEARKVELDELVAELTKAEEDLAARAEEIDKEIDRLQELRIEAYGDGGGVGDLRPVACPTSYPGGAAGTAINFACAQIGKPYVWGASGPDAYDCSGLTMAAWLAAGVGLPHNAASQRASVRYVDRSDLRPGDLVFYYSGISHVAIYAGDGWVVDAPQAGEPVRMTSIDRMPINSYGRPG
jgi:cell wall-associated NlpC family hydrolase